MKKRGKKVAKKSGKKRREENVAKKKKCGNTRQPTTHLPTRQGRRGNRIDRRPETQGCQLYKKGLDPLRIHHQEMLPPSEGHPRMLYINFSEGDNAIAAQKWQAYKLCLWMCRSNICRSKSQKNTKLFQNDMSIDENCEKGNLTFSGLIKIAKNVKRNLPQPHS